MPSLLIGSVAGAHNGLLAKPMDIDYIADFETAKEILKDCTSVRPMNSGKTLVGRMRGGLMIEVMIAWPGTTNEEILARNEGRKYADLNTLYLLKMSHRYLRNSPHFRKTMRHIKLMRERGAKITDRELLKRREKETYDYKHPNLSQNKMGFFSGDGVQYKYDHDSLHEAVAIGEKPVYKSYQKDNSEVAVDRNKWDLLPLYLKQRAVAEECAVLALERSLIPYPDAKTPAEAFELALEKVCTSITSGWFREFSWENHDEILSKFGQWDFVSMFEHGLRTGIVKET